MTDAPDRVWLTERDIAETLSEFGTEYVRADLAPSPDVVRGLVEAVQACDRFLREAMPKMNVADSALDANAIDAWNKAEIAVSKGCAAIAAYEKETRQ